MEVMTLPTQKAIPSQDLENGDGERSSGMSKVCTSQLWAQCWLVGWKLESFSCLNCQCSLGTDGCDHSRSCKKHFPGIVYAVRYVGIKSCVASSY